MNGKSNSFPQSMRLKKGHEFRQLREEGSSINGKLIVLSHIEAPDDSLRIGIIVSKKFDKKAVERNRAKRIIREAFRLIQHRIEKPVWIVFIARKFLHGRKMQQVQEEILMLLRDAKLLKDENGSEKNTG